MPEKILKTPEKKLSHFVEANKLLPSRCAVIVGLSGGPDSVALLLLLRKIAPNNSFFAAHLNHGIRKRDAVADQRFCENLCARLDIPLIARTLNVPALAKKNCRSLEEAARYARYEFFATAVKAVHRKHPACPIAIALGHHLDDQAETVLHRILRGTGVAGLGAIPARRKMPVGGVAVPVQIVRPLLETTRDEILQYLAAIGQDYRTDHSNLSNEYTRNCLRNELLPHLRERYNPKISRALANLASAAQQWTCALESAEDSLPVFVDPDPETRWRDEGSTALDAALLAGMPAATAQHALRRVLSTLRVSLKKITAQHFRRILTLVADSAPRTVQLPGGVDVRRAGDMLVIERRGCAKKISCEEFALRSGAQTLVAPLGLRFALKSRRISPAKRTEFFATKKPLEEIIDANRLSGPLCARTARPDDVFRPIGRKSTIPLTKFLAAQGLQRRARECAVVVADSERLVWVVGIRLSEDVRVTAATKNILYCRAEKIES